VQINIHEETSVSLLASGQAFCRNCSTAIETN